MVIYPQQIWYGRVTPDDVPRIIDETIVGGRVIAELLIGDHDLNRAAGDDPRKPPDAPAAGQAG